MSGVLDTTQVMPTLVGRSSSHFTRVVRIFAEELRVDCAFQVVPDLLSSEPATYGGNPALKLPSLLTADGAWFGALNICRELSRQSSAPLGVVWPEALTTPLLANTQELVVQAMSTEGALIMAKVAQQSPEGAHQSKLRTSLLNTMDWLERHAPEALAGLAADRGLSFLEVTLFCLVTHLEFRQVLPTAGYRRLTHFCDAFGARASAQCTTYHFDG